jgi:CheY-like chemotaxis protein/KaiC/GvpD/RAD55 family RecA-like ATPase
MESKSRKTIQSGIEPVDKSLGGLDSGRLYLVHGEAAPASLFGICFLVGGLKRGERVALIINYSPEEAIRRFARVGYDCLEDIYNGRLIILEWAGDAVHQGSGSSDLTAVLQELKWLMGETNPERIVFEPITRIVGGGRDDGESRAREFAAWAAGTGSTAVLIADDTSDKIIRSFRHLVSESFRFDSSSASGQPVRFIAFEKSPELPGQAIEVDASRGIFVGRARPEKPEGGAPRRTPASPEEAAAFFREMEGLTRSELDARDEAPAPPRKSPGRAQQSRTSEETRSILEDEAFGRRLSGDRKAAPTGVRPAAPTTNSDMVSDILGDLLPDQDKVEPASPGSPRPSAQADLVASITDRAVEELLSPPRPPSGKEKTQDAGHEQPVSEVSSAAKPEDFTVLAITGDDHAYKQISRALSQYRLHRESEGIGGLAKLISLRPDLVVLDLDLPVVDGFKVLAHIRASLNMPIIVISSSHLRASDRIQSMEMGADYYLTKPFSVKELRQKTRQLIARYRGIAEWITAPAAPSYVPSAAAILGDEPASSGDLLRARTVEDTPAYDERDVLRDYPDRTGEFVRVPYMPEPRDFRRIGREERGEREERAGRDERVGHEERAGRYDPAARGQRVERREEQDEPAWPGEKGRTRAEAAAGREREPEPPRNHVPDPFVPYHDFAKRVEEKVREAMNTGVSFSVVGCRLSSDAPGRAGASGASSGVPGASSGVIARRLLSLASLVVRGGDIVSINGTNDLVVLLADANAAGARAFVKRLTERAKEKMDREPTVWLRSFPALEDPDITEDSTSRA